MLYTHAGATAISRADLSRFPVPTLDDLRRLKPHADLSALGNRWKPVPFGVIAETIIAASVNRGLTVKRESYAVSTDGMKVYACVDFADPVPGRTDMSCTLGWRASNDQSFALKGVSGARVFVCDNGAIIGDFIFGHKMSKDHDVDVSISDGMERWQAQTDLISQAYASMESIELSQPQADHLLMSAVRSRFIAPSQLGKIDTEFRGERSIAQFGPAPTIRRLYEAVTEVGKSWTSPRVQERGLRGFPDLALRLYGSAALAAALTEGDLGDATAN